MDRVEIGQPFDEERACTAVDTRAVTADCNMVLAAEIHMCQDEAGKQEKRTGRGSAELEQLDEWESGGRGIVAKRMEYHQIDGHDETQQIQTGEFVAHCVLPRHVSHD